MNGPTRYCPNCSHIGEVLGIAINCCPDAKPSYIDKEIAEQAKEGFLKRYVEGPVGLGPTIIREKNGGFDFVGKLKCAVCCEYFRSEHGAKAHKCSKSPRAAITKGDSVTPCPQCSGLGFVKADQPIDLGQVG